VGGGDVKRGGAYGRAFVDYGGVVVQHLVDGFEAVKSDGGDEVKTGSEGDELVREGLVFCFGG